MVLDLSFNDESDWCIIKVISLCIIIIIKGSAVILGSN